MKKYFFALPFIAVSLVLISWGFTGHRTIGQIAYRHLTPQAKSAVDGLLGGESLADAATWADEVRHDPSYRGTASWHFINVPLGLTFDQFQQQVAHSEKMNAYRALLTEEKVLTDPAAGREQKVAALKFVAHFVGDIHQPMHVSRAEDKGGNTIQLNYEGRGTNLHALWDTKLLEHAGLNYQQLAEKYDHPTVAEIKEWQSKPPILWAWESYQISSRLYQEADKLKGKTIDNSYYESHIGIVERRIEQAGIRLAGVLNDIFKNAKPGAYDGQHEPATSYRPSSTETVMTVQLAAIRRYMGQVVQVSGKAYSSRDMGSFILVNLGAAYPDQLLTVVLRGDAKSKGRDIDGNMVTVTGKVVDYKGKPEIEVRDTSQVQIKPE